MKIIRNFKKLPLRLQGCQPWEQVFSDTKVKVLKVGNLCDKKIAAICNMLLQSLSLVVSKALKSIFWNYL